MTISNSSSTHGPSTLVDRAVDARPEDGLIVIRFASGHQVRFPVAANSRLASASEADLARIEISPFGLHWPALDEDLSFAGILAGRYGRDH